MNLLDHRSFDGKWKDQLLTWGGTAMTYDACGNMTKKGSTTYTWTQGRKHTGVNNGKSIQYYYGTASNLFAVEIGGKR